MQCPEDFICEWRVSSSGVHHRFGGLLQMRSTVYGGCICYRVVEQKDHVEGLDDRVKYWVSVSRRSLQHWDKKWLVLVFVKRSCSLWMACHQPRPPGCRRARLSRSAIAHRRRRLWRRVTHRKRQGRYRGRKSGLSCKYSLYSWCASAVTLSTRLLFLARDRW